MRSRLSRLNRELKKYDSDLYAVYGAEKIQIFRRTKKAEAILYGQSDFMRDQFIIALTDTWNLQGNPVEWGLEPIMRQVRSMDSWSQENMYEKFIRTRERNEELRKRRHRNELKALAYDVRTDFAKATNDINTSNLR